MADIPPIWKLASVTPIFKKGSPSDPSNYRPISLTCISSKLMEAGIKDHLLAHMKNSGALVTLNMVFWRPNLLQLIYLNAA